MHPILAAIPILLLVLSMTLRLPRVGLPAPAYVALPGAALLALVAQGLFGVDAGATMLTARVIEGLLTSLMPLAIVFGAVVLFRTLMDSGAMAAITTRLEQSAPDPVIRVVLIAWSFSYLVEGLSGFGTPAALAAPLLVGMGFPAVRAASACLVMNTVPVVYGAVGTPMWFGLSALNLSDEEFRALRGHAAVIQGVIAPLIVALGLRMLFSWSELRARWLAILVIVMSTVGASAAVATVSAEFPSIVGGVLGLVAAFAMGRLVASPAPAATPIHVTGLMPIWRAAFPLVATVLLLAVTRIEPLGLRALLNRELPAIGIDLGAVGGLSISAALVTRIDDILGTGINWSMPVLYVPFVIPFLIVSLVSIPLLKMSTSKAARVWSNAARSLWLPAVALAGALVFVKLMMHGGDAAPVVTIGRTLADGAGAVYGPLWLAGAPLVGALGSFFSGSATVSNLTFGPVQAEIAGSLGLERSLVLALQAVGGAIGNMVCVHNIVAVAAVLGLSRGARTQSAKQGSGTPDPHAPDRDAMERTTRSPDPVTPTASPANLQEDPVATILRLNLTPLFAAAAVTAVVAGVMSFT